MTNRTPDLSKRELPGILLTAGAAGAVAGVASMYLLGETGSQTVLGMTVPNSLVIGGIVASGSVASQYTSQMVFEAIKNAASDDTTKDYLNTVETYLPAVSAGVMTVGAGVLLYGSLPTLQGGLITAATGAGSYLAGQKALDMLLYGSMSGGNYSWQVDYV
jgi:hypothetical protein